ELAKSFGDKKLFSDVKFDIKSGEKICFIGENGVGKTTLLRIIMGEEEADDGYLKIGHNVDFGYYDQGQLLLDENETVLGEIKNAYHLYTDTEMRNILGRFLFRGDDVFKSVSALSGGEKARLSLLKLMLSGANTLIFDEPTNHLDIESKEIVEAAIMEFKGTVLIVSHDRYLLSKVPDRILELRHEGIREYKGQFDYYLEKSAEFDQQEAEVEEEQVPNAELSAEEERKLRKEQEAEERRRTRRIAELEAMIHDIEGKIDEIESEMCKPEHTTDVFYLREVGEKADEYKAELEGIYDEWLSLQEDE
ncbi:ATP-binding cassette domain-containing protein, partial [Mogibacterium pumilum]|uniref:ATP-binding cassette domain-containing protein n=1 Tax=Mogibacterium pumilum TaxID=86332 RepID=UPI0012FA6987